MTTTHYFLPRLLTGRRPVGAAPAARARRALLGLATAAHAQTTTCAYTSGARTYTVPAGITAVQVVATGAGGVRLAASPTTATGPGCRPRCWLRPARRSRCGWVARVVAAAAAPSR